MFYCMKKQTTHRVLTGIMALILASAVGGMALGTDPQVAEVQSHAWGVSAGEPATKCGADQR